MVLGSSVLLDLEWSDWLKKNSPSCQREPLNEKLLVQTSNEEQERTIATLLQNEAIDTKRCSTFQMSNLVLDLKFTSVSVHK